uniref:HDOD domain-containing protein n=1 Tax=Aliarcobacter sp. TaxID=2321116 RepID=UPI0040479D0A
MSTIEEKLKQLPFLPDIIFDLEKIRTADDIDIKKVIEVLEQNHFITTKILQMANSKLFGFSNHIDTLSKAISLYGINFTISFSIAQIIQDSIRLNLGLYEIKTRKFLQLSDYSTKLLLLWLDNEDISLKEELLLPCLVHEIGKTLICSSLEKEEEGRFFNALKNNPLNISSIEKEFCSYSSSQISAKMLKNWNFDENSVNIIHNIDTPNDKKTYILNVIKTIFNVKTPFTQESILLGIKKAEKYGLDLVHLKKALEELMILMKRN